MAAIFNVSVQSDMDGNLAVVLTNVSGCQGVSSNKDVQSSHFFGRAFFLILLVAGVHCCLGLSTGLVLISQSNQFLMPPCQKFHLALSNEENVPYMEGFLQNLTGPWSVKNYYP